jgi:hypothetical protein
MAQNKRKSGFYIVKPPRGQFIIAEWHNKLQGWYFCGVECHAEDIELEEIIEKPIDVKTMVPIYKAKPFKLK